MTDDRFERELRSWLQEEAAPLRVPSSLQEDIVAISTMSGASQLPKRVITKLQPMDVRFLVAAGLVLVGIVGALTLFGLTQRGSFAPAEVGASASASLGVTPQPSSGVPVTGRIHPRVDGILFSLEPGDWENPNDYGLGEEFPNYISRSVVRGQAAEGQIVWSGYPVTGPFAMSCAYLQNMNPGATVAEFADAVSAVPGTDFVSRTGVTVGGRPATKVVFVVRDDVGCDPGFFFTYENTNGGALWPETAPGDTVRVWVTDVGPRLLVIEAKTKPDGSVLEEEIQAIVDSIEFE
jgi:hypothetical protein